MSNDSFLHGTIVCFCTKSEIRERIAQFNIDVSEQMRDGFELGKFQACLDGNQVMLIQTVTKRITKEAE